jgi:hypothetical protein
MGTCLGKCLGKSSSESHEKDSSELHPINAVLVLTSSRAMRGSTSAPRTSAESESESESERKRLADMHARMYTHTHTNTHTHTHTHTHVRTAEFVRSGVCAARACMPTKLLVGLRQSSAAMHTHAARRHVYYFYYSLYYLLFAEAISGHAPASGAMAISHNTHHPRC